MQVINIVKGVVLTLEDGKKLDIPAGVQEVDDAIAEHWYVKAHTGEMPEAIAKAAAGDKGKKAPADEAKAAAGDNPPQ